MVQKFNDASYNYENPELDEPTDNLDYVQIMREMQTTLGSLYLKFQEESLKDNMDKIKTDTENTIKKRNEWMKKNKRAKNSGKVAKWLGIVGSVLGVVAAIGVAVLTGGAAIAIAAVAISVVAAITTGLQSGGVMDKMLDAMGVDDPKVRMGIVIGIQAALMIASLVSAVGVGSVLKNMSSEIPALISKMASAMKISEEAVTAGAKMMASGAAMLAAFLSVGSGVDGIVAGDASYKATKTQVDLKKMQASLDNLQSYLNEIQKEIKQAMHRQQELIWQAPKDMMNLVLKTSNQVFTSSPA
ncbi:MAG: hypothetical protein MI861_02535 [Pirellulales bacterium]|nr:hypothetical protein [Pirellulales bacterium]